MIFTILIYSPWNAYTGYTTVRYVNKNKYKSRYDILNHVVTEYWVYGEFGEGFGMPKNAFFTTDKTDDIWRLHRAGRSENIKWGRSDLKLGKFKFSDFLDCTDISNTTDLQFRLSERIFVYNNTLGPGIGYTPHLVVLGIGSGIPGIHQAPDSEGSIFTRSLKQIKTGIHQTQAQGAPSTLGGDFPYKPDDLVNFLGPHGRVGQGYITGILGRVYRVAHSSTQFHR